MPIQGKAPHQLAEASATRVERSLPSCGCERWFTGESIAEPAAGPCWVDAAPGPQTEALFELWCALAAVTPPQSEPGLARSP